MCSFSSLCFRYAITSISSLIIASHYFCSLRLSASDSTCKDDKQSLFKDLRANVLQVSGLKEHRSVTGTCCFQVNSVLKALLSTLLVQKMLVQNYEEDIK